MFLLGQKSTSCQENVWTLAIFDQLLFNESSSRQKLQRLDFFWFNQKWYGSWHLWSELSENNSTILPLIVPINRARKLPTHYSQNSNNAIWKGISWNFKCASTSQLWKLFHWCQTARLVCGRGEPAQQWCGVQARWHELQCGENSWLFRMTKHSYSKMGFLLAGSAEELTPVGICKG